MRRYGSLLVLTLCVALVAMPSQARHPSKSTPASTAASQPQLAFPGAMGWAATTPGGRGGQIIKVTTLNPDGPGSFLAAVETKGPRIVVFEVGGVIDLGKRNVRITEPYLTIAGQTAPSPGITLIRAQSIAIVTHDVIVQHLRIRPGDDNQPKAGGYSTDGIRTDEGAHDVIIDHCSVSWATNKNFAVSGPRFVGKDVNEWREHTSHRISVTNNLISEALSHSSHWKIEHSKGALIHDNTTDILIARNIFAQNYERSPLFKGGDHAAMINNLIYDPGQRAIHYNLVAYEWLGHPWETGEITAVGNVLRAGVSTVMPMAFFEVGGAGPVEFYGKDNIAVDQIGRPLPLLGRYTTVATAKIIQTKTPPVWPPYVKVIPADQVETALLVDVGARPWDRDYTDERVLANVSSGRGWIIDSQQDVHGYPQMTPTYRAFDPAAWNLVDMTPKSLSTLDASHKNTTLMVPSHQ